MRTRSPQRGRAHPCSRHSPECPGEASQSHAAGHITGVSDPPTCLKSPRNPLNYMRKAQEGEFADATRASEAQELEMTDIITTRPRTVKTQEEEWN